ncbi:MAG TPA: hypothetical protein VG076_07795 [Acidimicrobiales bacterium]|nr:hypothetical protein [Acidimicrobiales bacterium]
MAEERDKRVASRAAELEVEEPELAGDDLDAEEQAAAILADSDEREAQASSPDRGGGHVEHRRSEETVDPTP